MRRPGKWGGAALILGSLLALYIQLATPSNSSDVSRWNLFTKYFAIFAVLVAGVRLFFSDSKKTP
jgi:hypothetical protein